MSDVDEVPDLSPEESVSRGRELVVALALAPMKLASGFWEFRWGDLIASGRSAADASANLEKMFYKRDPASVDDRAYAEHMIATTPQRTRPPASSVLPDARAQGTYSSSYVEFLTECQPVTDAQGFPRVFAAVDDGALLRGCAWTLMSDGRLVPGKLEGTDVRGYVVARTAVIPNRPVRAPASLISQANDAEVAESLVLDHPASISVAAFIELFRPRRTASQVGLLFPAGSDEVEDARRFSPLYVWSLRTGGESPGLYAGYHEGAAHYSLTLRHANPRVYVIWPAGMP